MRSGDRDLLTPGEVASLFGVDPKTVARWANEGQLDVVRTLGGHRRFRREEVQRLAETRREVTGGTGA